MDDSEREGLDWRSKSTVISMWGCVSSIRKDEGTWRVTWEERSKGWVPGNSSLWMWDRGARRRLERCLPRWRGAERVGSRRIPEGWAQGGGLSHLIGMLPRMIPRTDCSTGHGPWDQWGPWQEQLQWGGGAGKSPIRVNWRAKGMGVPCGLVVKYPPACAGDMGSIPGWGRFHMPRSPCTTALGPVHQSLRATTAETCTLEPVLRDRGANAMRSPLTATRE